MLYPTQRMHLLATMLAYGILSAVVAPVSGPDLPFVSRPAQVAQYPAATELVDLPLLGFDPEGDLLLVLALAVQVLLPVRPSHWRALYRCLWGQYLPHSSCLSVRRLWSYLPSCSWLQIGRSRPCRWICSLSSWWAYLKGNFTGCWVFGNMQPI